MLTIHQTTPSKILSNQHRLYEYLAENFSTLVNKNSWFTEWEPLLITLAQKIHCIVKRCNVNQAIYWNIKGKNEIHYLTLNQ
jgi:hypothetical protein